jgi:hypothetical protein
LADAALAKMAGGSANQQVLRVSRGLETAAAQSPRVQTLSTTSRNELHDTAIDQLQPDAADALASDLGESAYQQRMAAQLERLEHLVAEALDADLLG